MVINLSDFLSCILGRLCGIYCDILSGILSGILSNIDSQSLSDISYIVRTTILILYVAYFYVPHFTQQHVSYLAYILIFIWHLLELSDLPGIYIYMCVYIYIYVWWCIRRSLWHPVLHLIWHLEGMLSEFSAGFLSDKKICHSTAGHRITCLSWHSIWHPFWHFTRHSLIHPFWFSIRHMFRYFRLLRKKFFCMKQVLWCPQGPEVELRG